MNFETIIVGGGPAALQLGYFLQKGGHNYVILEKAPIAASFFDRYPHSGKLISINKKYTGRDDPEFNLRHDWNSLLSEDDTMRLTNYSDEYYPDKKDIVRYMNDFATKFKLNIQYNSEVVEINKEEDGTYSLDVVQAGKKEIKEFTCSRLIIATGLSKEIRPNYIEDVKRKIMHYKDYPKDYFKKPENLNKFKNKSVLIIGSGNAAFELGNLLQSYTSSIIISGRSTKPWAISSHYPGDLRSIYMPLYDSFLLGNQNGLTFDDKSKRFFIDQHESTLPYLISIKCSPECETKHVHTYGSSKAEFDHVIYCTGCKFDTSFFQFEVECVPNEKFPTITQEFESVNNKNLFFIGSLMHSFDFNISAGGFIHGFRYLIKYFYQLKYSNKFDVETFNIEKNFKPLMDQIYKSINKSSSLYHMNGHMSDIFYYEIGTKKVSYYSNVHATLIENSLFNEGNKIIYILTLEYGNEEVKKIEDLCIHYPVLGNESQSNFLHPVLSVFTSSNGRKLLLERIHFSEDILADFSHKEKYYDKMGRTLRMFF